MATRAVPSWTTTTGSAHAARGPTISAASRPVCAAAVRITFITPSLPTVKRRDLSISHRIRGCDSNRFAVPEEPTGAPGLGSTRAVAGASAAGRSLVAVLVPVRAGPSLPMLDVVRHPQSALQSASAELVLDPVRDFVQTRLPLPFSVRKETPPRRRPMFKTTHAHAEQANMRTPVRQSFRVSCEIDFASRSGITGLSSMPLADSHKWSPLLPNWCRSRSTGTRRNGRRTSARRSWPRRRRLGLRVCRRQ